MAKESLQMEQTQQTVQRLSHRQVMFVRILEMSGPELEDEVRRQLDDNPALETVDIEENETYETGDKEMTDQDYMGDNIDDDPADIIPVKPRTDDFDYSSLQIEDDIPDLYTSLNRQLGEIEMPDLIRQIAQYIIGNIDENGWMGRTLAEMSEDITISTGMDISHEQMREAFSIVRSLDPAGIGAVDLRDCLLLQLRRIHPKTLTVKIAENIIDEYFDLFSKHHFDRLQTYLGISREEMEETLKLIRSLNPKPGSAISVSQSALKLNHIIPDVSVEVNDNGSVSVALVNNLPQLQIEKNFVIDNVSKNEPSSSALAGMQRKARIFIRHKRDEAEDFINALKQRANTLLRVTEAIVKLQPDFFQSGDTSRIRPMILKDIEAITGLDISMISRATAGKYVSISSGTFPLKMFFNEATQDDNTTSTHKILQDIRELIDNEDKKKPMSDEEIQKALIEKGYDLARRTVAKYREKLGIPVKRLRKEYN